MHPSLLRSHYILPHHHLLSLVEAGVVAARVVVLDGVLFLLPVFLGELVLGLGIVHDRVLLELLGRNLDPSYVLLINAGITTLIVLILVE